MTSGAFSASRWKRCSLSRWASWASFSSVTSITAHTDPAARFCGSIAVIVRNTSMTLPSLRRNLHSAVPVPPRSEVAESALPTTS